MFHHNLSLWNRVEKNDSYWTQLGGELWYDYIVQKVALVKLVHDLRLKRSLYFSKPKNIGLFMRRQFSVSIIRTSFCLFTWFIITTNRKPFQCFNNTQVPILDQCDLCVAYLIQCSIMMASHLVTEPQTTEVMISGRSAHTCSPSPILICLTLTMVTSIYRFASVLDITDIYFTSMMPPCIDIHIC